MENKKNYMFTNKKHPPRGVMSTILGMISLISMGIAVYFTFLSGGEAGENMGLVGLLAACFSTAGLVLGILAKGEPDRYRLFTYLGIALNLLGLTAVSMILYAGAYGIG